MTIRFYTISLLLIFVSCKSTYTTQTFQQKNTPPPPNYNNDSSWAVLPSKYTAAFKTYAPKSLDTLQADVFYVYPTLITTKKDIRWNVPIDDNKQNESVLHKAVLMQASAFATSGKVYTPFYRQAHIRSYSLYKQGGKEALELAYSDVKNAFETYLKTYNNGRPIIMVGHSQGTTHTSRLLKEFFDNKPLQKQLVAAYIPGIRLTESEFSSLKVMTSPNETGGIVSWNTYKKNNYPKKNNNWYKGAITSNPITWNTNTTTTLKQHKGFLFSNEKLYKNALTINITDGLVWSSNPKFPLRLFMSFMKNYHAGDINLFWQDIKENAELRVNTWLQKNHL